MSLRLLGLVVVTVVCWVQTAAAVTPNPSDVTASSASPSVSEALGAPSETVPALTLVGKSKLRMAMFHIFTSALYTPSGQWTNPSASFRFELTYARAISGRRLARQTAEEWKHLGFEDERRDSWVAYLVSIWPDVIKGDTITFDVTAKGVSRFFYNGTWVGSVDDPDFAPAFIAIWLSPDTSRPAHRRDLLAD